MEYFKIGTPQRKMLEVIKDVQRTFKLTNEQVIEILVQIESFLRVVWGEKPSHVAYVYKKEDHNG